MPDARPVCIERTSDADWRNTRHWVAWAPAGVWSSGPAVIHSKAQADEYAEMDYDVRGPFVLATASAEAR